MATTPPNSALSGAASGTRPKRRVPLFRSWVRASQSMGEKNEKVYKELGLFSLKKKIEDAVIRAEMLAPTALEAEEARRIQQEEMLHKSNLWDDLARSNESLTALADATKVVDSLKDMRYKAEEAKLIIQLAEMDVINHQLFKQAYKASIDVSKFLDRYEISKCLNGPYDKEGACLIVRAGPESTASKKWAEKLLHMYTRWAEKHHHKGRVVEKYPSKSGGVSSAVIEFESEYAYGYLSGEKGVHRMIRSSLDGSVVREACSANVDVIPLFLEGTPDLHIDDTDLLISSASHILEQSYYITEPVVSIQHIPSGIAVKCSGERSQFANKIKALSRLKAKLLVLATEQGVPEVKKINRKSIPDEKKHETRRYMFRPQKSVQDVKTGIQLPDLNSVLDGNIDPLIKAFVTLRHGRGVA